jgi:hypothetical protein
VTLLNCLEREDLPTGDYIYLDVIETISESAVPLHEDSFDGEQDSCWRLNTEGYFELVRGRRRT